MFDHHFQYTKLSVQKGDRHNSLERIHIFSFKTSCNKKYYVNVEQYINHIYVVKYFRSIHKKHPNKCHLIYKDLTIKSAVGIINTCFQILMDFLKKNSCASFGFVGANTITEGFVEDKSKSKRYRIYKRLVENIVGNETFEQIYNEEYSMYLLINLKNPNTEKLKADTIEMFKVIHPELF